MPSLDSATQRQLLDLLAPLMAHKDAWRGLLSLALGVDGAIVGHIEWGGALMPFILRLLEVLVNRGESEPSK